MQEHGQHNTLHPLLTLGYKGGRDEPSGVNRKELGEPADRVLTAALAHPHVGWLKTGAGTGPGSALRKGLCGGRWWVALVGTCKNRTRTRTRIMDTSCGARTFAARLCTLTTMAVHGHPYCQDATPLKAGTTHRLWFFCRQPRYAPTPRHHSAGSSRPQTRLALGASPPAAP